MERTITQTGALYFVQHKGKLPDTPRLLRTGLPRTAFYHNDLDKRQSAVAEPDEQISKWYS
ncbi:MAG TPA: hypothetical protein VKE30_00390 [Chthoniobacterales bacterium]|nr:hypothetical protein [Chthoniobacterales bacterium]